MSSSQYVEGIIGSLEQLLDSFEEVYEHIGEYVTCPECNKLRKTIEEDVCLVCQHSPGKSHVYFIYASEVDRIKIGYTNGVSVERRLADLSCASPCSLELYCLFSNVRQGLESAIHKRFKKYRIRGEWFDFDDSIKEFLLPEFWEKSVYVQ